MVQLIVILHHNQQATLVAETSNIGCSFTSLQPYKTIVVLDVHDGSTTILVRPTMDAIAVHDEQRHTWDIQSAQQRKHCNVRTYPPTCSFRFQFSVSRYSSLCASSTYQFRLLIFMCNSYISLGRLPITRPGITVTARGDIRTYNTPPHLLSELRLPVGEPLSLLEKLFPHDGLGEHVRVHVLRALVLQLHVTEVLALL